MNMHVLRSKHTFSYMYSTCIIHYTFCTLYMYTCIIHVMYLCYCIEGIHTLTEDPDCIIQCAGGWEGEGGGGGGGGGGEEGNEAII